MTTPRTTRHPIPNRPRKAFEAPVLKRHAALDLITGSATGNRHHCTLGREHCSVNRAVLPGG